MQITLEAKVKILKERDFERVMEAFIDTEMAAVVQAFLQAALVRIPVSTGFLRGSFGTLASYFNVKGIPFNGRNAYKRLYQPGSIIKSPSSGRPLVTKPQDVIQKRGKFGARIEIINLISYFEPNDTQNTVPGTPWNATEAGLEAANARLQTVLDRIPKIEQILSTVTIIANGKSVRKSTQDADVDTLISQMKLDISRGR